MEIIQITDYDTFLQYLAQQYKEKPNFKAVLQGMNTQAEDLEEALFEIRDNFWITTAEGEQLDILGDIQGEDRGGKSDSDYRDAIQARIIVNNGSGEFETIITALTELFGATIVQLQNWGDAALYIWSDILLDEDDFKKIVDIIASGVELHYSGGTSNPFVFYEDTDGEGFGKLEDTILATFSDTAQITFSDAANMTFLENESCSSGNGGEFQGILSTT